MLPQSLIEISSRDSSVVWWHFYNTTLVWCCKKVTTLWYTVKQLWNARTKGNGEGHENHCGKYLSSFHLVNLHFKWTVCSALWQLQYVMQRDIEKEKKYFITCHYSSFILCVHFWVCLALAAIEAQKTKIQKWETHKETQKMGLVDPKRSLRETDERINNFKNNLLFLSIFLANYILYISCHRLEEPQSSGIE